VIFLLCAVGLSGCGEDREERLLREIARVEAARHFEGTGDSARMGEEEGQTNGSPAEKTPPGFSYAVSDGIRLVLGMSRADALAALPGNPDDADTILMGDYEMTLRRLGDRSISLTFVKGRLAMMTIRGRYSLPQASDYRTALERTYGKATVEGERLIWEREDPVQSLVVVFHPQSDGYDVETTLIDAESTADIRTGAPFPAPPP